LSIQFKGEGIVQRITSKAQLDSLRENPPEKTDTWLVDEAATDVRFAEQNPALREMTSAEVDEMAEYLEVDASELDGPFFVAKDVRCPNCDRATTFLDFIKTAVDSGLHDKALVREVLAGRAGRWITVVGQDGGREAVCVACERPVPRRKRAARDDCEYHGEWYRYG
jgi:hypothetical protein